MALRLSLTLVMLVAGTALLVASSSVGSTAETPKGGTLRLSSVFDVDSVPLLAGGGVNLNDPALQRRIDAANRRTGEARRRAWANLDVDLMRNNPPWAPSVHPQRRVFVSRSTGCVLIHPVYGFDIAAVCKK